MCVGAEQQAISCVAATREFFSTTGSLIAFTLLVIVVGRVLVFIVCTNCNNKNGRVLDPEFYKTDFKRSSQRLSLPVYLLF